MRLWKQLHSILGTLLAPFFVLWLLSGLVMIFSSYPRLGDRATRVAETLPRELPPLDSVLARLPEGEQVRAISLGTTYGVPTFSIETDEESYTLRADSTLEAIDPKAMPEGWCLSYAQRFSAYPISHIDTLDRIDTWTSYERNKKELPIYRFSFDDPDGTWLYLSGRTGKALQCCTAKERLFASVGTVPHMFYYWWLRQDRDTWLYVVCTLGCLGAVMCLSGLVVGISILVRASRRKRRLSSPYRGLFRWHHIGGLIFGLSLMLFALSGAMSLMDLDNLPVRLHDKGLAKASRAKDTPEPERFLLDYRRLLELGEVKEITWRQYGPKAYYEVTLPDEERRIDGEESSVVPLFLTEEVVRAKLEPVFGGAPMTVELMEGYDNYYAINSTSYELPIYRVSVEDPDRSRLYVSPTGGYSRYYSLNDRIQKWIYPFCHNLRSKFFSERQTIRIGTMILLVAGGLVVSGSGVILGYRYLRRRLHKRKS